jgi:hypothetical protein
MKMDLGHVYEIGVVSKERLQAQLEKVYEEIMQLETLSDHFYNNPLPARTGVLWMIERELSVWLNELEKWKVKDENAS